MAGTGGEKTGVMAHPVSCAGWRVHSAKKLVLQKLFHEAKNPKAVWHMESTALRNRTPCEKDSMVVSSVPSCSEEIDTPKIAFMNCIHTQSGKGNPHLGKPQVMFRINPRCVLKS